MTDLRYYKNTPKLPAPDALARLAACGATKYTAEEIIAIAKEADETNRAWVEVCVRATEAAYDNSVAHFLLSKEELARSGRVYELSNRYNEVRVIGAKRHSSEAFPVAQAKNQIRSLKAGIKKMEKLAQEFESNPVLFD